MGDHIATDHQKAIERLANLDDAERELLEMISAGNYDREIAGVLHVSPRTVKRRVADLLETLGVDRRIEAAYLAGEAHLLDGQVDR